VEPYHLPKYHHVISPSPPTSQIEPVKDDDEQASFGEKANELQFETMEDEDMEEVALSPQPLQPYSLPRTMRQMAEDARRQRPSNSRGSAVDSDYQPSATASAKTRTTTKPSRAMSTGNSTPSSKGKVASRPRPKRKRIRDKSPGSVSDSEDPSPMKRGRGTTITLAPTRVLRPRASKNATKILEEHEQEQAFS